MTSIEALDIVESLVEESLNKGPKNRAKLLKGAILWLYRAKSIAKREKNRSIIKRIEAEICIMHRALANTYCGA